MARRNAGRPQPQQGPSLPPEQAAQLLRSHCAKGKRLVENRPITSAAEEAWETVVHDLLIRAFGSASPNVDRVMRVGRFDFAFGGGSETAWEAARAKNMATRLEIIDGLIELLDSQASLAATGSVEAIRASQLEAVHSANKVFLVHGHDEAAIHETARFLEGLDLRVTILREQPNSGRTIIEKFIDYADVGFAVVLLTGDDRGGLFSAPYDEQEPRARQNVILELGFFLGKLGRKRVCVLYQEGVGIPSDYSGVLFIPIDARGAWRLALARELKAAGLQIDTSKVV
jgi:predicted nucleotide-binding protein